MGRSRVAFLAIQKGPGSNAGEPRAILVGTKASNAEPDPGFDWRYVCYPLSTLIELLSSTVGDLFEPGAAPGEHYAPVGVLAVSTGLQRGFFSKAENGELRTAGFKNSYLNKPLGPFGQGNWQPTRRQSAIVLRNIERVFFFSHEKGGFEGAPTAFDDSPYAVLETLRYLDADSAVVGPEPFATVPDDSRPTGSRLVLFPDWSVQGTRPGALAALSLHLALRSGANGHVIEPVDNGKLDRLDTRALLAMRLQSSVDSANMKNLWIERSLPIPPRKEPDPNRGIRFDTLKLGFSLAAGLPLYDSDDNEGSDLFDLAAANAAARTKWVADPFANPPVQWKYQPALHALGITKTVMPERREFGFRALRVIDRSVPDKLGWRFESRLSSFTDDILKAPAVSAVTPRKLAEEVKQTADLLLAEEQRLSDIKLDLRRTRAPQTILTLRFGGGDNLTEFDKYFTRKVIGCIDGLTEALHAGLKTARDGRPLSLVPRLDVTDSGSPWHLVGALTDEAPGVRTLVKTNVMPRVFDAKITTLEPRAIFNMWAGSTTSDDEISSFTAFATFPRFVATDRTWPRFIATLSWLPYTDGRSGLSPDCIKRPAYQPAVSDLHPEKVEAGTRFRLVLTTWSPEKDSIEDKIQASRDVILGSMRLTLARNFGSSPAESFVRLKPVPVEKGADQNELSGALEAIIRLPVESAGPATEDELPDAVAAGGTVAGRGQRLPDRDTPGPSAPLLFDLTPEMPRDQTRLVLVGDEAASRDRNQDLSIELKAIAVRDAGPAAAQAQQPRLLVIEPQPFRVLAVEYQDLAVIAALNKTAVAIWRQSEEGGASWEVPDSAQRIRLIAPPQVLGEAMEKNRSDADGRPPDIAPDRPAAARFGSLTTLDIDPTFEDRTFREPGWNLARILGRAGQRSPGARLLDLRTELHYGLITRVRVPDLWTTEIAGAIGRQVDEKGLSQGDGAVAAHEHRAQMVLEAARGRMAIEKLWRGRPDADLTLDEGVSFKLRHRISARKADALGSGPATQLRWPVPGALPDDTGGLIDREMLASTFSTRPDDRESFPGGVSWAFESANILMSVYGRPQADGGSLAGVHLSALGGYGSQRALFDGRRTIVESMTSQGRVHRYRLERVGRINCLWNRAKHVIVYERTVTPSAQFYNQAPIGLRQDEQLGRAILRKVEEYIEILQPLRRFPEDGSSLKESAFLLGAEFKSTRIRVDSAWGEDVRREGWKVPLWSTEFLGLTSDPKNPDDPALIYPKPQIRVLLATDGGEAAYEISDPEKLAFYTSVVRGEDDNTDAWRSVRGVDFCDLPFPVVPRVDTGDRDLQDAKTPNEREHATGYEWCTLAIAGSGEPVRLTHGRTPGAIAAILTNVTIARGAPQTASDNDSAPELEKVRQIGEQVARKGANLRAELDKRVARVLGELGKVEADADPQVVRQRAKALVKQALGDLEPAKLKEALKNTRDDFGDIKKGITASGALCDNLSKTLKTQAGGQITRISAAAADLVKHSFNELELSIAQAHGLAHRLLGDLSDHLKEAEALAIQLQSATTPAEYAEARAAAEAALSALDARIAELNGAGQTQLKAEAEALREYVNELESSLRAEIVELRRRIGTDVAALKAIIASGAEKAFHVLEEKLTKLQEELKTAIATITGAANQIDQTAVAAAKTLRSQLSSVRAYFAKAAADLERSAAPAAARRLLQTLEQGLNAVDGAAAGIERGLGKPKAALLNALKDAQTTLDSAFGAVKGRLDSVRENGALDQLSRVLDQILDEAQSQIEALLTRLGTGFFSPAVDALKTLAAGVSGLLSTAAGQLTAAVGVLRTALQGAAQSPIPPAALTATDQLVTELQAVLVNVRRALLDLRKAADSARENLDGALAAALAAVGARAEFVEREALRRLDEIMSGLRETCEQIEGAVRKALEDPAARVGKLLDEALGVATYAADLEDRLFDAIDTGTAKIEEIRARATQAAEAFAAKAEARARELAGSMQETAREVLGMDLSEAASRAEGIYQKGDSAIRAIRALGNPPHEDHLGFNKEQVGYVLGAKKLGLDVTPMLALVNRAGDYIASGEKAGRAVGELLDSFGVRLPVSELADQLIPDRLKDLSVSDLLPDMGGIDFRGLLSGVGFPDLDDSKAVRIRRGVDPASLRAWMEATLEIPFAEPATLFHFGPVEVAVERAFFTSRARMSAGPEGFTKEINGRIFGDWRVACGGQTILTFRQTGLTFESDGHIDFKIQPDRVEIAEALRFITDLMKATGQKGGLNVAPFLRGGIPTGVAATLDMVLPPIQTGAFGIQDLSLHVLFGIAAIPEFELVCELSVGTRIAPFTLNIWVLNGGGWLTQRLSFLPMARPQPLLTYHLEIGIAVGLGIGFSFGVISGGIYLQVGCSLLLDWRTGSGGSTTAMRVFVLLRGNVDVAGLITAYLLLLFDLVYDGRNLIGHGTMHFEVRVSVFYTFSVTEHVQYVFAGSGESEEEGSSSDAYG